MKKRELINTSLLDHFYSLTMYNNYNAYYYYAKYEVLYTYKNTNIVQTMYHV